MRTAVVIKPFKGRPDNSGETIQYLPGAVVEGDLARVAIENGWAEAGKHFIKPDPEAIPEFLMTMTKAELVQHAKDNGFLEMNFNRKKAEILAELAASLR